MKVASVQDIARMYVDLQFYGECYCDEDGKRVDPRKVIVAPDGSSALDSGGRVYRPDRFLEDQGGV